MNDSKFSLNALLIVLMVFSALGLFVTDKLYDMAGRMVVMYNYAPIEGTDLGIKYSTLEPSGIYRGPENNGELVAEGDFGYDWGAAVIGDQLYINEYSMTSVDMTLCDLVRIDTKTFDREVVQKNTILRGRCRSGELVCVGNAFLPSNKPEVNSLCKFYAMTSNEVRADSTIRVLFIDPETGKVVYSVADSNALANVVKKRYLDHTLEEVMR